MMNILSFGAVMATLLSGWVYGGSSDPFDDASGPTLTLSTDTQVITLSCDKGKYGFSVAFTSGIGGRYPLLRSGAIRVDGGKILPVTYTTASPYSAYSDTGYAVDAMLAAKSSIAVRIADRDDALRTHELKVSPSATQTKKFIAECSKLK